MSQKIMVLGTGGTIAGVSSSPTHNVIYQAARLGVDDLLARIDHPALSDGKFFMQSEQVLQLDSKDMGFDDWSALYGRLIHFLRQDDVSAIVVTHGTDTLEETAFLMSRILPQHLVSHKPVVFTCAMRPSTSLLSDGLQNIHDAITVATDAQAMGVLVVCASTVHRAEYVSKAHTYRLHAFDSGELGSLGFVEEGKLRLNYPLPEPEKGFEVWDSGQLYARPWPRVEIIMNYVGADGALVHSLCSQSSNYVAPLSGLIVAGTGNGTLSQSLENVLLHYQSKGLRVQRCTRCAAGNIVSDASNNYPLEPSRWASPMKARIEMMLSIMFQTPS